MTPFHRASVRPQAGTARRDARARRPPVPAAVHPGISSASDWDYVGYKGGSEPGVMTMAFLLREGDAWYVVTGSWNHSDAAVDEARFAGLTERAVLLTAEAL